MTKDDKFGLAAGALALGLAAGIILIMQFSPKFFGLPDGYTRALPETIFDGIVCAAGLLAGVILFYLGACTKDEEAKDGKQSSGKQKA